MNNPDYFASLVPESIKGRSGSVFYSGRSAFSTLSRLYILGLNPGGSPSTQAEETIERNLANWMELPESWSAYCDDAWEGRPAGMYGMQPRILHMLKRLGLNPREVPASNVIFVRSATEATLVGEKTMLLPMCWKVHEAVIQSLGVDTILCLGGTAGLWVRQALGADTPVDEYAETNARGWRSFAHANKAGQAVVTVSHPGRADWRNPAADPTELVERVLNRRFSPVPH